MRRAWLIASESPHLPILAFLGYFGGLHIVTGTSTAPDDLAANAPQWLIWAWAMSLLAGSTLAFFGLITERTRLESVGLVWSLFGIAFYMADQEAGPASVLLAAMCLIRLNGLRRARKTHARVVQLIAEGER